MVRGGPNTKKISLDYKKVRILNFLYSNQKLTIYKYMIEQLPSGRGWNISAVARKNIMCDLSNDELIIMKNEKVSKKRIAETYKITDKGIEFIELVKRLKNLNIDHFEMLKALDEPNQSYNY